MRGRYSLIGLDPDLVFRAEGTRAEANRQWSTARDAFAPLPGDPLTELRALLTECRIDVPDGLPPALACVVGYFAYETMGLVEAVPRPAAPGIGLPDMVFVRPTLLLVFDRLKDELFIVAPIFSARSPDAAYSAACERIEEAVCRRVIGLTRTAESAGCR